MANVLISPRKFLPRLRSNEMWTYFGPAFVASVAYIDPGNFATNIEGGSRFGYRLLWVLLWSNAMAILIQYLSAKLGIVTDLAEFLGAALGFYLLVGPTMLAHGWSPTGSLFVAALVSAVLVFLILALDL